MSNFIPFSKKEMLKDLRAHCRECFGNQKNALQICPKLDCRFKKYLTCNTQIDVFDASREEWLHDAEHWVNNNMPDKWYWSEIREKYPSAPAAPSWWGALSSILLTSKNWVRLDTTRTATFHKSRHRREFLYTKNRGYIRES